MNLLFLSRGELGDIGEVTALNLNFFDGRILYDCCAMIAVTIFDISKAILFVMSKYCGLYLLLVQPLYECSPTQVPCSTSQSRPPLTTIKLSTAFKISKDMSL